MKELDLTKSLYDLTEQYSELVEILGDIGFLGAKNPVLRNTVGRVTTIPQGCKKMGIDINTVVKSLTEKGYQIKNP